MREDLILKLSTVDKNSAELDIIVDYDDQQLAHILAMAMRNDPKLAKLISIAYKMNFHPLHKQLLDKIYSKTKL